MRTTGHGHGQAPLPPRLQQLNCTWVAGIMDDMVCAVLAHPPTTEAAVSRPPPPPPGHARQKSLAPSVAWAGLRVAEERVPRHCAWRHSAHSTVVRGPMSDRGHWQGAGGDSWRQRLGRGLGVGDVWRSCELANLGAVRAHPFRPGARAV